MRIAVTGATGFIGRHVLAELARRDVEVIAAVRGRPDPPLELPRGRAVRMDVAEASSESYDGLARPHALIHLAWGGLPNYRSLHHFEQERPMHYRFLRELVVAGLPAAVVAGTCFEYGMRSGPLDEGVEPRPCTPYGHAKDALRRELEHLRREQPFALTWARLFYLYGPGQPERSLFSQLRRAVERGDETFDMSGGEQLRDYLPVERVAVHLVDLAMAGRDAGVVNVCSGEPVSVRGLVERMIRDNGWRIGLNLGRYPYPDYVPMAFWGVRDKLDRIAGSQ